MRSRHMLIRNGTAWECHKWLEINGFDNDVFQRFLRIADADDCRWWLQRRGENADVRDLLNRLTNRRTDG